MNFSLGRILNGLWWGCFGFGVLIALVFLAVGIGEGSRPPLLNFTLEGLMTWCLLSWLMGLLLAPKRQGLGALMGLCGIGGFYLGNLMGQGAFPGGPVFPLMWIPPLAFSLAWACGKTGKWRAHTPLS
ncbi:MAG: hypothetical protein H3C30_06520 [Candidatus Hydrogenedentes bacterium]|nr:hypothetical protein [Candidatus Hydrogenedentota bacterium]